ncbi:MAG: sel1 repeat family protein [Sandaracinaceae bacterium]|nr:sel1 repeat family protein [Sandaracinaceae bacterium]
MTTHGSPARPLGALLLALALSGCGAASPPPPTTQVEATPPACTSYQELRGDRCMYVVEAEERCQEADGAACTAAGEAYLLSGQAAGDVEHAAELYARACELGDAEGCNRLGSLHEDGDGVALDLAEAARLYAAGCELGSAEACTVYGAMLADGDAVAQDAARAVTFYERACRDGEPYGCGNLGAAYLHGEGVAANVQHAMALLERACESSVGFACAELGWALTDHPDVPRDESRAMTLFERACALHDAWGCHLAGRSFAEGAIVPLDVERAQTLLTESCELGEESSCEILDELAAPAPTPQDTAASCASPARLTLGREVTGTTADAVNGLVATCGLRATSPDRVYTLVITRPTRLKVDLFSDFDGVVHIRSACSVAPEGQVACNDDAADERPNADERHSALEVELQRGTYFVVVDGYAARESGAFRLLVDRAP